MWNFVLLVSIEIAQVILPVKVLDSNCILQLDPRVPLVIPVNVLCDWAICINRRIRLAIYIEPQL